MATSGPVHQQDIVAKAGRSDVNVTEEETLKMEDGGGKNTWRCPDPGCKKSNEKSAKACAQCTLPRQSAEQFKKAPRANQRGSRGRGWGGGSHNPRGGLRFRGDRKQRKPLEGIDLSNPTIATFQSHARELDKHHDKYERIIKLSRDITIESKRVIFLLHRITCPDDKDVILGEAEEKFRYINKNHWYYVAKELRGEDPYKFIRAYTNGLQEYIEALSFYYYLFHGRLIPWKEVQEDLTFVFKVKPERTLKNPKKDDMDKNEIQPDLDEKVADDKTEGEGKAKETGEQPEPVETEDQVADAPSQSDAQQPDDKTEPKTEKPEDSGDAPLAVELKIKVFVPQLDYILGLADLTGEVMRQAINMVSAGDMEICFELLQFLHEINAGYLRATVEGTPKFVKRKMDVLQQSLRKVENACYTINVRGMEIPKHLLGEYFSNADLDPDTYSHHSESKLGHEE